MIIRLSTVKFKGSGAIDCRLCGHRTVFPDNTQAIIYRTGPRQIVVSALDLARLHICGRVEIWVCETCGTEIDAAVMASVMERLARAVNPHLKKALQRAKDCPQCGGRVEQRRQRPQAEDEPVD